MCALYVSKVETLEEKVTGQGNKKPLNCTLCFHVIIPCSGIQQTPAKHSVCNINMPYLLRHVSAAFVRHHLGVTLPDDGIRRPKHVGVNRAYLCYAWCVVQVLVL